MAAGCIYFRRYGTSFWRAQGGDRQCQSQWHGAVTQEPRENRLIRVSMQAYDNRPLFFCLICVTSPLPHFLTVRSISHLTHPITQIITHPTTVSQIPHPLFLLLPIAAVHTNPPNVSVVIISSPLSRLLTLASATSSDVCPLSSSSNFSVTAGFILFSSMYACVSMVAGKMQCGITAGRVGVGG